MVREINFPPWGNKMGRYSKIYDSKEIFSTYARKAQEKTLFVQAFSKRVIPQKSFSLLDLGCNDGELILRCLKGIKLPKTSKVVGVECSESALSSFKLRKLPKNIDFEFKNSDIETFLKINEEKFDWAVASHSLYWTSDLNAIVNAICKAAQNVAIVMVDKGGFNELEKRFWPLVRKQSGPLYNAEDISDALAFHGYDFTREVIPVGIPISPKNSKAFQKQVGLFLDTPVTGISNEALQSVWNYLKPFGSTYPYNVSFFWIKTDQEKRTKR